MGLDQYAYKRDAGEDEDGNITIAAWRKHNRLHGWMEELWEGKGRPNFNKSQSQAMGDFNCQPVELTLSDIEELEGHITDKSLPETGGFFFGIDSYEEYEEYYKEADLQFVEDAREALGEGKKIFYNSWW